MNRFEQEAALLSPERIEEALVEQERELAARLAALAQGSNAERIAQALGCDGAHAVELMRECEL